MPRTPDSFPGDRLEDVIQFYSGSNLPETPGEMLYASGSVSGSGFFFKEENNAVAQVIELPKQIGMIPFAVFPNGKFIPALPITNTLGWMINSDGILLVSASID